MDEESRVGLELVSTRRLVQLIDCSPKTVQDWLYKDRKTPSSDRSPSYFLREGHNKWTSVT
jgi:hypothetical protein